MAFREQATTGFLDGIANHMAGIAALSLTKGVNLYAESFVDNPDGIKNHLVLYDEGYEEVVGLDFLRCLWNVRLATSRKTRLAAAEALRPYVNQLRNSVRFTAVSDNSEKFQILRVSVESSPDVTDKLDSGFYYAEAIVQFDVIPPLI